MEADSFSSIVVRRAHIQNEVGPLPKAPKKPMRSPKKGSVHAMKAMRTT